MVMEVFPTAALPQSTSLTAFLLLFGLVRTLEIFSEAFVYFFEKKHIEIIIK
jgi:hypothetical protein